MIAVHCGAGKHSDQYNLKYRRLCSKACRAGMEIIVSGGSALEAVKAAVIILEDDPISNAGTGSNLTIDGQVECDAAIMDGDSLLYGGCGSTYKVKNPIALAYDICIKQMEDQPLGLIPPSLLVGKGALAHAKNSGLKIVKNQAMISTKAQRQLVKYKKRLPVEIKLDTVGAVCVSKCGGVASACSSGGLLLKRPGRVGQGALYGSGVWADSYLSGETRNENLVAACTSGCGEYLVRTQLAKEVCEDIKNSTCPITALAESMKTKFMNSRFLQNVTTKNAGALVVHVMKNGVGTVLWGHSTETMSVGYMTLKDTKPKSLISKFPKDAKLGSTINVGGNNFRCGIANE